MQNHAFFVLNCSSIPEALKHSVAIVTILLSLTYNFIRFSALYVVCINTALHWSMLEAYKNWPILDISIYMLRKIEITLAKNRSVGVFRGKTQKLISSMKPCRVLKAK